MRNQANITLMGNVTKSEMRHTPSGFPILQVTVAGDAPAEGAERLLPFYQRVDLLGKLAEAYEQRVPIGTPVFVNGTLRQRSYDSDAGKRSVIDITANTFGVLEGAFEGTADAKGNQRMVGGRNEVVLIGNITREPEQRFTTGGDSVVSFSVAVNRVEKDEEKVSFFNVSAWNALGERVATLAKGTPVVITGRIRDDNWTDAEGNKRYGTSFVASDVQAFARNGNGAKPAADEPAAEPAEPAKPAKPAKAATKKVAPPADEEFPPADDLPF